MCSMRVGVGSVSYDSLARRRKSHFELWQMEQRFQDSTGRPKILPKI